MSGATFGLPSPTRLALFIWVLALTGAAVGLIASGVRASRASTQLRHARAELHAARRLSSELQSQTLSAPQWMSARREETGLAPRFTAALTSAGLPATAMTSFSVQRELNIGGKELGAARERATCVLGGITLPQLGQVLALWRDREPQWTPTSFDISPSAGAAAQNTVSGGGDMPLRVVLTLESVYVEDRVAALEPSKPTSPRPDTEKAAFQSQSSPSTNK